MTDPIPLKRPLTQHEDIPPMMRDHASSIAARSSRIKSVLGSPAALPEMRAQAKGELVLLAAECLELWGSMS